MMSRTDTVDSLPPPNQLGLPERFGEWRPGQSRAAEDVAGARSRYVGMVAPTGFGKSIVAEAISVLNGGRSVYHVVTKALQDQIYEQMVHRYDVRGKSNYDCHVLTERGVWGQLAKCDRAEHLCDTCSLKMRGCDYFDRIRGAQKAQHVLDNYAMWLATNKYTEGGLGEFTTAICDEAHQSVSQLCSFLAIELGAVSVERFTGRGMPPSQPMSKWRDWAAAQFGALSPRYESMLMASRVSGHVSPEQKELRQVVGALDGLRAIAGDWIEERISANAAMNVSAGVRFEPVWPGPYLGQLVREIPRIVLMSATIRPKTLELLGIPAADTTFLEYPSSFPVANRPVVHVKTVQMRAGMSDAQRVEQVRRIDQIIDRRLDRKGIIHTVSYERARYIAEHSRHRALMIQHDSRGTAAAVERYKKSAAPCILVSPAVGEGYDFPGALARYQIIAKVPFQDSRSPVTKARMQADDTYGNYVAMQALVQMAGRAVRSADDWAETLICDDQFGDWFYWQCLKLGFVPAWFAPAVRLNETAPRPPALSAEEYELTAAEQVAEGE